MNFMFLSDHGSTSFNDNDICLLLEVFWENLKDNVVNSDEAKDRDRVSSPVGP